MAAAKAMRQRFLGTWQCNSINNGQVTRVTFSYILFVDVEKSMRKSKQE